MNKVTIVGKPVTDPNTLKTGDVYIRKGRAYLVATVGQGQRRLISLESGNAWDYLSPWAGNKEEFEGPYTMEVTVRR